MKIILAFLIGLLVGLTIKKRKKIKKYEIKNVKYYDRKTMD